MYLFVVILKILNLELLWDFFIFVVFIEDNLLDIKFIWFLKVLFLVWRNEIFICGGNCMMLSFVLIVLDKSYYSN